MYVSKNFLSRIASARKFWHRHVLDYIFKEYENLYFRPDLTKWIFIHEMNGIQTRAKLVRGKGAMTPPLCYKKKKVRFSFLYVASQENIILKRKKKRTWKIIIFFSTCGPLRIFFNITKPSWKIFWFYPYKQRYFYAIYL